LAVQSDANGLFHKTIHIARRSVQDDGVAEVGAQAESSRIRRNRRSATTLYIFVFSRYTS
jgi:hypothetical protein